MMVNSSVNLNQKLYLGTLCVIKPGFFYLNGSLINEILQTGVFNFNYN